jgi:hypothetical protein
MNTHCIKSKSNSHPKWLFNFVVSVFLVAIFLVALWQVWGQIIIINLLNGDGPEYMTNLLYYSKSLEPGIIRKETSKYYEALTRKLNRYFGIEFHVAYD